MKEWAASNWHILVTSRKEVDLSESLDPLCTIYSISIQGAVVKSGIQKFIRAELSSNRKLRQWSKEIQDEIERTLFQGADGMQGSPVFSTSRYYWILTVLLGSAGLNCNWSP
jgi:hypothetical protein